MDSFKADLINELSNLEINDTSNVNTVFDTFEEIILIHMLRQLPE